MTSAIMLVPPVKHELANKGLISNQLWERLVNRIMREASVERPLAERIMDQTLAFLRLAAIDPASYSPSPLVDVGWHTFILYTLEYAEFCKRIAGFFIHHAPFDGGDVDHDPSRVSRTVEALRRHGIVVDEALWFGSADCCPDAGSGSYCCRPGSSGHS